MNRERVSFKEEAQKAYSRGEWRKALEFFQKHCIKEPEDLRSQLKVAELLERLGHKKESIQVLKKVAASYAKDGFLLQAISVNKMILRLDPTHRDVHERLAHLYTERTRQTSPSPTYPPIPLLSDLNREELESLLQRVTLKTFPKETYICREGETGNSLYIIMRGVVAVTKQMPKGREVWVRNLREGDFFGEFSFFTDQKRHANVKAVTECEILEISQLELQQIIKTHPHVKEVLQNFFQKRVLDFFLAISPFFSCLNFTEREEVLKRFHLLKFPKGRIVFRGGDPAHALYLVKSGEVEIFTEGRHGRRVVLGKLKSGSIFGEIGVLFGKPRMATAQTTQPSELYELTKKDLEDCLQLIPILQSTLKEISYRRLARMKEMIFKEEVEKAKEAMV
ncbi:MAG: cyclic nucleotide-binding domain-containing protein [Thermodesulfobacteriota bacterium]